MSLLIFADSVDSHATKASYEAVSYGAKIANGSAVTVVTYNCSNAAELGAFGATNVLNYEGSNLDSAQLSKLVVAAAQKVGATTIIFSHDYTGKAVAPRVAAQLKAGLVAGAVDYPAENGAIKKAVFSGKAFAMVQVNSATKVISVMPNSVGARRGEGSAAVESFSADLGASKITLKEVKKKGGEGISLTEADIVVSAGRGLKGPENWGMIEELATELGAATACSRPVADIGWRPHHEHVGQTGVAVRPNLYFAIGISGAIQHLAGVNGSKVMVVINTDAEAPFFKAADYGIVGDAFEVVPKLIEAVKNFKAANN